MVVFGMLIAVEGVVVTLLAVSFALMGLVSLLGRNRPDLRVRTPLAVGFVLRLIVIAGVSLTGIGSTLRGGDEVTFLDFAHQIVPLSWTSTQWLPTAHKSYLQVLMFAAQIKLLGSSEGAMRITQVGISLAGVLLIAAAVYDIAGPGPARLTAWLLNLEIASLFFNELLGKEALMELASGLVVFGGAKVWRHLEYKGLAIMGLGALIAVFTREYVGWFLVAGAVAMTAHAALRQLGGRLRSIPIIYAIAGAIFLAVPVLLQASSSQSLQASLQPSQDENATSTVGNGAENGNNLALEQVDYSTRGAIITNLPQRMSDVLLKPYPWQVGDTGQMLGVLGSIVALTSMFLLVRFAVICRGQILRRAAPLIYPLFFMLIAYALSVGNAGTGFRYRTQLVTLIISTTVVLRSVALAKRTSTARTARQTESERNRPTASSLSGGERHAGSLAAF
jgi:putative effector of murein hydrolase LrgA (UPF0299 family)